MIKSRGVRWVGHVARIRRKRNSFIGGIARGKEITGETKM
jgi:hypothetical protein